MSLQLIPHDTTKHRINPVELINIVDRNMIGYAIKNPNETKLLITGNGASISDATGKTVTVNGGAAISSSQSKIGGTSIYLDGSGDYLTLDDSADWEFGTDNFTIDWWEYRTSSTDNKSLFSRGDADSRYKGYTVGYASGGSLGTYISSNGSSWDMVVPLTMGSISLNEWVHFAVVRIGTGFTAYKNGVSAGTATSSASIYNPSDKFVIGMYVSSGPTYNYFTGYVSHIRVTRKALWTTTFSPPTLITDYFKYNNYIGA